jgi:hypothetical protein
MRTPARSPRVSFCLGLMFGLLCPFAFPSSLLAQSDTATLSGRINDQTGAAVDAVDVTVFNTNSGTKVETDTNDSGIYVVPDLRPGPYDVTVEKSGFRKVVLTGLVLEVQDALSRNFTLQVGQVNDSVTVVATKDQIDVSPAVSTLVNQEFVQNMPLNGRTFQSLLALAPGYAPAIQGGSAGGTATGQFGMNGMRASANYFLIDGVSANYSILGLGQSVGGTIPAFTALGSTGGLVSVDAMQEFRMLTSTFTPEFGRTPGAQISIVTRSGSNALHGTLFDYLRNDAFDARNYFDAPPLPKPPLRQNDFGGTVSGPIRKDRAFYFFSYEGLRLLQPVTAQGHFLTIEARENLPANVLPYVNAEPIPNGLPDSDGITAQLTAAYSDPTSFDSYSLRIDYNISDRITLFGRYNHSPSTIAQHNYSELINQSADLDSLTLGTTVTLGPNKVNDLRFNWSQFSSGEWDSMVHFYGAVPPPVSLMYPPGYNSSNYQLRVFIGSTSAEIGNGGSVDKQRQLEFADTFSYSTGAHQLKFGGDVRQLTPTSGADSGALIFPSYVQLQAGLAGGVETFVGQSITSRIYNYSLFAQDVWRATTRLSVTYGLRWEINTPLTSITPGWPLLAINGIFNSEPFGYAPPGTPLWHTHFHNFAPRIGAAYQVTPQTMVRGGFGLFYDIGFGGGVADTMTEPYSFYGPSSAPVPLDLSNPAFLPPSSNTLPNTNTYYMYAVDPKLNLPLVYEWNVAVEQALGTSQALSVTYLGSYGTRLLREDAFQNNPSGDPVVFVTRNADWSNYNALQVQFQRRLSRGLQVLASYTLAHSLDTNSIDVCQCTYTNDIQSINVGRDYGPSDFDVRNTFAAAVSYEIPSPYWDKVSHALLRNWALYGIWHVNSSPPYTIFTSQTSPAFGPYYTRPDFVPGEPIYIPNPSQPNGRQLNPAAFVNPPPGEYGDVPRNYFRGYPTNQIDLAVSRRIRLTDRASLYFRVEYFNILNHPMFAPPWYNFNNFVGGPGFGTTTATLNYAYAGGFEGGLAALYQIGGPRSGQLTLKLQF